MGEITLADQRNFAELTAGAALAPKAYQGDPGSILIAVNLGTSMGLSPAESLYRIHVIEGKPSASAELITSNVRRAGHRLRSQGDAVSATVEIVRSDDPDFTNTVTWTIDDAERAGLLGKDNWRKYPAAMLLARATTQCARQACPEALYGVIYTPEELDPDSRANSAQAAPGGQSGLGKLQARLINRAPEANPDPEPPQVTEKPAKTEPLITDAQLKKLWVALRESRIMDGNTGEDKVQARDFCRYLTGRSDLASSKDLTKAEATRILDILADPIQVADACAAWVQTWSGEAS